jgi:DNA-directed RNA polymerase specialized sigma24 family protein
MDLMETPARFGAAFEEILGAAHAGAGWAFERLYRWLSPAVLSYVRGQRVADPEDVVGDIFMKAFHKIDTFRGSEEQFRSWVFTVAHHASSTSGAGAAADPPQTRHSTR